MKSFFHDGAVVFEYKQKAKIFDTPPTPVRTLVEAIDSIAKSLIVRCLDDELKTQCSVQSR
jgi:hypothetical protein